MPSPAFKHHMLNLPVPMAFVCEEAPSGPPVTEESVTTLEYIQNVLDDA